MYSIYNVQCSAGISLSRHSLRSLTTSMIQKRQYLPTFKLEIKNSIYNKTVFLLPICSCMGALPKLQYDIPEPSLKDLNVIPVKNKSCLVIYLFEGKSEEETDSFSPVIRDSKLAVVAYLPFEPWTT